MKIENPVALNFIFQDELYLLNAERHSFTTIAEPVPTAEPIAESYNYLGKNQRQFLILVHYPAHEFMDAAHLAALTNILKRKELALDDVAIINLHHYQTTDLEALNSFFSPVKIVVMGRNAIPAGMEEPVLNTPLQLKGRHLLYSFSFDDMMSDNERKKLFWEQMKTI